MIVWIVEFIELTELFESNLQLNQPLDAFRIPTSLRGVGPYGPYGPEAEFMSLCPMPHLSAFPIPNSFPSALCPLPHLSAFPIPNSYTSALTIRISQSAFPIPNSVKFLPLRQTHPRETPRAADPVQCFHRPCNQTPAGYLARWCETAP
jgi:hypothetical protein